MNTQLVNSIIQVIRALPTDEQQFVLTTLNRQLQTPEIPNEPSLVADAVQPATDLPHADWELWQSLGDDAVPGTLDDPSTQDNRYLYADT